MIINDGCSEDLVNKLVVELNLNIGNIDPNVTNYFLTSSGYSACSKLRKQGYNAALCNCTNFASMYKENNNINVIVISADMIGYDNTFSIIQIFNK